MSSAENTPPVSDEQTASCLHSAAGDGNLTPSTREDDVAATSHDDNTPSPSRLGDDAAEESFQNPEPPKELAAGLLNADNIGGTVFSKHWLFTTLMRLLEVGGSMVL